VVKDSLKASIFGDASGIGSFTLAIRSVEPWSCAVPEDPQTVPDAGDSGADVFDGLVLDETFVKGGAYEPPARTRQAIARFGDEQTTWRYGGGIGRPVPTSSPTARRRSARAASSSSAQRNWVSWLPLIVSALVVIFFAVAVYR
jgi:hypothetical protein